MTEASASVCFY